MKISPKRAEYLSIAGLILSVLFFGALLAIWQWCWSFAVQAAAWQMLGGVIVWFVLLLQFHQRSLAEREKLDLAQLARTGDENTIFEAEQEQKGLFAVAQRRLELFEKWFLPVFAILIAAYEVALGVMLVRGSGIAESPKEPLVASVYMVAIAFVTFLMSRYATGMSSEDEWRPLKAGGGFLAVSAVCCFLLAVGFALARFKSFVLLEVMDVAIPVAMIVLGIETAMNVILDMYRPRIAGRYRRAAFDSRLLSLVNEPGTILQTAAGAMDYQFGFKVSQTWFYKLLAKAILPLVLFAAVTLYLLSCIVVIKADEEAIIEHFGKPINNGKPVGPGLTFKWPWPIDVAYSYPTRKIQQLNIGFKVEDETKVSREPLLWNLSHYKEEYNLLVANKTAAITQKGSAAFSIIIAAVPIQFKVKDLYAFLYNYGYTKDSMTGGEGVPAAVGVLEDICYRELVMYTVSSNSTQKSAGFFEGLSMLGADREEAAQTLRNRIQKKADEAKLGVELVFVGMQVHPPKEVATDYEDVIGAVLEKRASILDAVSSRNETLGLLAGSVNSAEELGALVRASQGGGGDAPELDKAFENAGGQIFSTLRKARSEAYEKTTIARATGERFQSQVQAYRAAPVIYKRELRLSALEELAPSLRKYVIVTDPADKRVTIIDMSEKMNTGLYDITPVEQK
jgi:membrane protease subunit HflK